MRQRPVQSRLRFCGRGSGEERMGDTTRRVYCVVPWELAGKLHDQLREHFRTDATVEVVVERRAADRRRSPDRRATGEIALGEERRKIRNAAGRRVGERRAPVAETETPTLPRSARKYADQVVFVERLEPSDQH